MFNLNEKYFSISERCGRNHQNKFCLRPLKGRLGPWELNRLNLIFRTADTLTILFNFTKICIFGTIFAKSAYSEMF